MKNLVLSIAIVLFSFTFPNFSLAKSRLSESNIKKPILVLNESVIHSFFKKYSALKKQEFEVVALYKNRNYKSIWFEGSNLIPLATLLHEKSKFLAEEGLVSNLFYTNKRDEIFGDLSTEIRNPTETEIQLTTFYIVYVNKVFRGIEASKTKKIAWFLPKKEMDYNSLLDSMLLNPQLLNCNIDQVFGQYYKLKDALKKYRQMEKNDDWDGIEKDPKLRDFNPNDSSKTIAKIRHRLFLMGDLKIDSKSYRYDKELMDGILNYKKRNGYKADYVISRWLLQRLNLPISAYIKTIQVNMERCRWINPTIVNAKEALLINIPSYTLVYKKDGITALESNVFVGEIGSKTEIFSSNMTEIVFSPYWNIPESIIENEIKASVIKDRNYLITHNIDWNNGKPRQKPGPTNSLGLVKFVFPNPYSIFLHDSPSKDLFDLEYRTFSHGCINMKKAKELSILILKEDPNWPLERINEAMKGEVETTCVLKRKIPVYVGYFTAWVDDLGVLHFYEDVYQRDGILFEILQKEQ